MNRARTRLESCTLHRLGAMRSSPMLPAVALVPGFFGFDHHESRTYFADRFVAGLRASLEARGRTSVPVVAVSTLGIASMWRRQHELLRELRALESPDENGERLGRRRWHLVGHSTGGVDAALLLRNAPLVRSKEGSVFGASSWGEWQELVARIDSVTSISAPHFGTGLAESPLAQFSAGRPSLGAVRDAAMALFDLARRGDLESRIAFAFSAMPRLTQTPIFLGQMALRNELARELRPRFMSALSSAPIREGMESRLFSVATVAPRPGRDHSDKLFRDLWSWGHKGAMRAPPSSAPGLDRVEDPSLRLPSQRETFLPPIDEGDNDGIVTTRRQVFGELNAVVLGDHVDVLGRYRRASLVDGKVIDPGLLTSGARFGDDEFFALLDRVAARIAAVMANA